MTETAIIWLKIAGASVGSSIAVVFQPGRDRGWKLVQRFVIGAILGFIGAAPALDWLGWPRSPDYWLAAATLCGLGGYLCLQIVFSTEALDFLRRRLGHKS